MKKKILCCMLALSILNLTACNMQTKPSLFLQKGQSKQQFYFPVEDEPHEGTWLNWPHHYTYGAEYRDEIEDIWVQMVEALQDGENVHIVAYNDKEKQRIINVLQSEKIDTSTIDFVIAKSDDVWARDTGPMFVKNDAGKLFVADFAFDGWGKKTKHKNDDAIPVLAAKAKDFTLISIPDFVLEGGSVEVDGKGTAMLCKSSVISKNRNEKMSEEQAEAYLSQYLGISNFIWLNGVVDEDITDAHIDGIARFFDENILLTVSLEDFMELYEGIDKQDYETMSSAKNASGKPYEIVTLPTTKANVKGLDYKGSYLNFYVGNDVVLLPTYGDENDEKAAKIVAALYKTREIVPIDVSALYQYGGMLHCITQQQPTVDSAK